MSIATHTCIVQVHVNEETRHVEITGDPIFDAALKALLAGARQEGAEEYAAKVEAKVRSEVKERWIAKHAKGVMLGVPNDELDKNVLALLRRGGRTAGGIREIALKKGWIEGTVGRVDHEPDRRIGRSLERLKRAGKILFTKAYMGQPSCWIAKPTPKELR